MPKINQKTIIVIIVIIGIVLITISLIIASIFFTPKIINEKENINYEKTPITKNRLNAFEKALEQNNKELISDYLANQVNLIIYATECCGIIEKSMALNNLDYLKQIDSIDFDQKQAVIKSLKNEKTELKDYTWGLSNNDSLVGYKFNEQNVVTDLYLAIDYKLLSGEPDKQEESGKICKDLCGDGICQEIVCLGTGCPCAETKKIARKTADKIKLNKIKNG